MRPGELILAFLALAGGSGLVGGVFPRTSKLGQWVATLLNVAGCGCGLWAAANYWQGLLAGTAWTELAQGWQVVCPSPLYGIRFQIGIDPLSFVFLLPVLVLSLLGSIYALHYWPQNQHPSNGRRQRLFWGLLTVGLAVVFLAENGITFLFGWEFMAISAFFLVGTDDHQPATRAAAWLYIATSHVATLLLFFLFSFLNHLNGTYDFVPLKDASQWQIAVVLVLGLTAFGIKAGLMPGHFWLPSAHAMAPSHVSAFMSGVLIKTGVYGILRIGFLAPHVPAWWGLLLLAMGGISGVLGIAYAIGQQDLKRTLAYSSIENVGVIMLGAGLAFLGRTYGRSDWIVLGMSGALLHVWNHSLFKGLLFLCAGSVLHGAHTRDLDKLGALCRTMPRTALYFLLASVAICALPPLNGFISEFYIYLGLFRTLGADAAAATSWPLAGFAAPVLALIGALALACFVRAYGTVFLGAPRSEAPEHAHEAGFFMRLPMFVLAAGCLTIGLAPVLVAPIVEQGAVAFVEGPIPEGPPGAWLARLAPLAWLTVVGPGLAILLLLFYLALRLRVSLGKVGSVLTWDCGYAAPSATMQYTGTSFGETLVLYFRWALWPRTQLPVIDRLFPPNPTFDTTVPDVVLNDMVKPATGRIQTFSAFLRILQNGSLQLYLLYILLTLIGLPVVVFAWAYFQG